MCQLIIISGPSGAGKSTVVRQLIRECTLPLELSISVTTRRPREGEVDGQDYMFVSEEQFENLRRSGKFLECKQVFGRDWYGTLLGQVEEGLAAGKSMILEIDVQGALTVMDQRHDALSFFVHPGSRQELENRLRSRGTESEAAIRRRLEVADEEYTAMSYYKHEIINRDVNRAVKEIWNILQQHSGSQACLKN